MLQAYFEAGMTGTAVFELFVRKLPSGRNFLVAAGLEQAVEFLEGLRFGDEELAWIRSSGVFKPAFAEHLARLQFTGDVHAMPEGTVFFPNEPILRVTAPMPEAQLVESRLLNLVHFEVMVASKAARSVLVAPGKRLVDFGMRRAHGAEAGLLAARAAYLAGFDGSSVALAGPRFGIPVFGTMAHSFVQAHDSESAAFLHFARAFPASALLLIDTYDTVAAARKVALLAPELAREGIAVRGVLLDRGDLAQLARTCDASDEAGLKRRPSSRAATSTSTRSATSSRQRADRRLRHRHQPRDLADAPSLDAVYKLQEYAAGRGGSARPEGDLARPQAGSPPFRAGRAVRRRHGHRGTDPQPGEPLLDQVMAGGSACARCRRSRKRGTVRARSSRACPDR
jgi:nicotinate phosphoribosyltransferase